jgi:hypothetical protein
MKSLTANLGIFGKLGITHALACESLRSNLVPDDSAVENQAEILVIGAGDRCQLQKTKLLQYLRVARNTLGNHAHKASANPARTSEHKNPLSVGQHDRPRIREVRLNGLFTLALDSVRRCGSQIAFLLKQRYQRQRQHAGKLLHISPFWGKEHALYLATHGVSMA